MVSGWAEARSIRCIKLSLPSALLGLEDLALDAYTRNVKRFKRSEGVMHVEMRGEHAVLKVIDIVALFPGEQTFFSVPLASVAPGILVGSDMGRARWGMVPISSRHTRYGTCPSH